MADKDPADDGPSLELPSFGFGRRKRRERDRASHPEVPASPDPGPEVTPSTTPEVPATPGRAPEVPASPDPGPEVVPGAAPDVPAAPAPDAAPERPEIDPLVPSAPDEPAPGPEIDPLLPSAPEEPAPAPEIEPVVPTRPEWQPPADPEPEPHPERHPEPGPEPDPEPETAPDPNDPDPVAPPPPSDDGLRARRGEGGSATSVHTLAAPPTTHEDATHEGAPTPSREPRSGPRFPVLPPLPAALVVGAVVGLAAVLLTWGSLQLCDAATGTASCGGGPGLLMLVAILIALTYLGGWLLRGFGIGDAGSTSLLAVGLLAVVTMLFLVDSLDEWSGAVLVVVVTVAAYALSWRVTAVLVDAGADER